MKKILAFLIVGFYLLASLTVNAQPTVTMYVNGRYLYSAVGEKVVLRGVNEMFVYSGDKQGVSILPQIAQTGANSVRIVWNTGGSATDLDALLGNCINNKMIPIVQLDDITGNIYNLQTCLNYWKRADVIAAMNKYKKWVLLNIANEAGDNNTTDTQYQTAYIDAVAQLRGVGYTMPFIIDAAGYGQNENTILNTWNAILQSDPQHNIIFSLHPYWKDAVTQNLQTRFTNVFNAVVANNIPFMIGEGPQQTGWDCSTTIPYSWVMQQCQTNEIGWLVWTWGAVQDGTGGCANNFDVTTNGNFGSWSNTWGQAIAITDPNSIQHTSVRPPSIYGNLPPDTQAPTTPLNLAATNTTSNTATLTWTASTDNVGVTGYNIYNGTTLLASSVNNSTLLSGLACNTGYSFTVKAKDAAGNLSVASNVVSITTPICDTQAPTSPTNLTASNVSTTSTLLSWTAATDNVGVTNYQVFRGTTLAATTTATSLAITALSCNTPYLFTVKAVDAAGNVSASSNGANITTNACPTGEIVYDDNLNANWEDWSWSAYRYFNTTTPTAAEGVNSIKVEYGGYGGFSVRKNAVITPTTNTVIKFWAYSTGVNSLDVSTQPDDSGPQSNSVFLNTVANQWQEYTVTMANLGNPSAIKRINIKNNSGNSPTVYFDYIRFDSGTSTPDTQAPTSPTNLTTSNVGSTSLTLAWTSATDNVGVTSYQVFQGATMIASNITGTTYNVTNLSCATSYSYTVKAVDAAGNSSIASNSATATTSACSTGEIVYDDALNVNWADWSWSTTTNFNATSPVQQGAKSIQATFAGFSGFSLRKNAVFSPASNLSIKFWVYSTGANAFTVQTQTEDSGVTSNSYNFTTTANQWQEVTVTMAALGNPTAIKRINIQNNSSNSVVAYFDNIQLTTAATDTQAPTSPTNLATSNISQTGLTLTWTGSTDNVGVANYQVYQGTTLLNGTVTGTTYTVAGLNCNTQYNFSVTSKDAAGNTSPVSNVVTPTTLTCPDTQAPTAPTALAASAITQTGLTLTWTGSTDNVGVANYQVYQGATLLNGTVTGTTYTVAGLACGTTYSFTVKAKDAAGNQSGSSNVVSATTSACGASTIVIYDETLNTDWNDWSWATTRNFSNTTPVKVGTKSAKIDYTAWGGLSLRKVSTTVNTIASTAVRFWVRTPTATTIKVYTSSTDTGGDASGYTFTTTANVWTEYIVSLAQLGNPAQIKRIHFQNYTANNVTAYFDNIRLVSVSGARVALEEEEELSQTLSVFPNPSTGVVNVDYIAEKAEKVNVQVVGLSGLVLQEREEQAVKGKNSFSLDLSTEKIGFYLIRLQNESKSRTSKVLIQR
ncbi:chitodextrinase [Runella defluvii]|uniref:Chitodextrinase n=1 Tax=Runella defluvii TaxID=370973 RepID=A0A7W5ZJ15_9BACT|nr:fibronectin type III domain-containing protein [Runella defluvii]MBB3837535.1 chitodextrinase [Runella defluvii]